MPKQPTSLFDLGKLIEEIENKPINPHISEWLNWAFASVHDRKMYHKRRQIIGSLAMKELRNHLSEDELQALEEQAELQVQEQEETDESTPTSAQD